MPSSRLNQRRIAPAGAAKELMNPSRGLAAIPVIKSQGVEPMEGGCCDHCIEINTEGHRRSAPPTPARRGLSASQRPHKSRAQ